jgi:hypothetical protein
LSPPARGQARYKQDRKNAVRTRRDDETEMTTHMEGVRKLTARIRRSEEFIQTMSQKEAHTYPNT